MAAQNPPNVTDRRPGLDVIRATAIALVMLHHFRWIPDAPPWFVWFALRSYIGVDLFFVLSGWLIGGQLMRELAATGTVQLGRFWTRRWLRTLPAYWAVLALLVAAGRVPFQELGAMLVFAQNYTASHLWPISWSLCIEEHFYVVLPLAVLAVQKLPKTALWLLGASAVFVSPVLRWADYAEMTVGSYQDFLASFYSPTHLRLEGLALGVGMAALARHAPALWATAVRRAKVSCALGIALVVGAVWNPLLTGTTNAVSERMAFFPAVLGFLAVSVGTALVLPLAAGPFASDGPAARAVAWIADHAYALYLVHAFMPELVADVLPAVGGFWLQLALCVAASFLAAAVLRKGVELRGLKLRDRLLRHSRVQARRPDPGGVMAGELPS